MNKMSVHEMPAEELRRRRILEGAREAFLAYGFQRTTMDDIARAAEISRPALYLMFKNKTDIYRALAIDFGTEIVAGARAALAGEGTLAERLGKSVGCAISMAGEIETSPHGAELLDMKNKLAEDVIAEWRREMVTLVEAAIEDARQKAGKDAAPAVPPTVLANMLVDALDGMKLRQPPLGEQQQTAADYIGLIARMADA